MSGCARRGTTRRRCKDHYRTDRSGSLRLAKRRTLKTLQQLSYELVPALPGPDHDAERNRYQITHCKTGEGSVRLLPDSTVTRRRPSRTPGFSTQ